MAEIHIASSKEINQVLQLMLAGISSDPDGMLELKRSWWRHLMFRKFVGPRMLRNQMDTWVAVQSGQVQAYLVVQYLGDVLGTFDWAVVEPRDPSHQALLHRLLQAALTQARAQGAYTYFFFGLRADAPTWVTEQLQEAGFHLMDYQLEQMVAELPLEAEGSLPPGFALTPQFPNRFADQLRALLPLDYPDASPQELAGILATHEPTLAHNAKILQVEREGEAVGFLQQTRWRDELRLLLALAPELWGSPEEQQLVVTAIQLLGKRDGRVRFRTFSRAHLAASRPGLEALGLRWEPAPWHRWLVHLTDAGGSAEGPTEDRVEDEEESDA